MGITWESADASLTNVTCQPELTLRSISVWAPEMSQWKSIITQSDQSSLNRDHTSQLSLQTLVHTLYWLKLWDVLAVSFPQRLAAEDSHTDLNRIDVRVHTLSSLLNIPFLTLINNVSTCTTVKVAKHSCVLVCAAGLPVLLDP